MEPLAVPDDVMHDLIDADWFVIRKFAFGWVAVPNPKYFTDKMPCLVWDWGNRDWEPGPFVQELPDLETYTPRKAGRPRKTQPDC